MKTPAKAKKKKPLVWIWILAGVWCALFFLSFIFGRYDVPLSDVFRILLDTLLNGCEAIFTRLGISLDLGLTKTWTDNMATAIINIRLPRIALACLVGGSLAVAGTSFQSVFHNPMASPDILGASSGACFGAALAILLGFSKNGVTLCAFAASLSSVALVYLVGSRTRGSRVVNILLAGMMVSSLFSAGTSYIKLVADPTNQLPAITYWLMGSLSGAKKSDALFMLLLTIVALVPLLLLRWRINLLTLTEEEAMSMGVNTKHLRLAVILCATLLTASSVAVTGMIGWVGLVVPHLCRKITGSDCRYLLPATFLFGASFLLLVDNISRNLLATEIPIGILTAFVGAPFFLYLMTRKENSI